MKLKIDIDFSRKQFWHRLMLFAYHRLCRCFPPGKKPVGIPGNRDPEMPCTGYEPRPFQLGDWQDCEGDGHYECQNCCHLKREEK